MTKKKNQHVPFAPSARHEIETARKDGRHSTANNYETALRSLLKYAERHELMLTDITPNLIEGYQRWLKLRRIGLGTISCYMRSLRSLYKRWHCSTASLLRPNPFPWPIRVYLVR